LIPGQVYWVFLGTGAFEKHPVIVVSRAELNSGAYFLGVPVTSKNFDLRRNLPNCVPFTGGDFGFTKNCVAQAEAVSLIRKQDLVDPVPLGQLSTAALSNLIGAIGNVVGAECRILSQAPGAGE